MDSLNNDPIKESWSVQTDESKTEITIRSQVWPGYVAYHRVNSPVFGGAYLGTGLMNFDLPFIVWSMKIIISRYNLAIILKIITNQMVMNLYQLFLK